MRAILVTGHKGFIGGHLWAALTRANDCELIGIDRKGPRGKDIRDCALPPADLCFHLAASTDLAGDILDQAETNIYGTLRILRRYKSNVVLASSAAVNYLANGYAVTKMAGECYTRLHGGRIVRLCNITGDGGHGVMEKFRSAATLHIAGDGEQIRTFAPVEKAVEALIAAASADPGHLTIVGGEDMTVNEIASRYFPDKPRTYISRMAVDVVDGRQIP
jgi:nucleoside-diphosphate-sugar epimerase